MLTICQLGELPVLMSGESSPKTYRLWRSNIWREVPVRDLPVARQCFVKYPVERKVRSMTDQDGRRPLDRLDPAVQPLDVLVADQMVSSKHAIRVQPPIPGQHAEGPEGVDDLAVEVVCFREMRGDGDDG